MSSVAARIHQEYKRPDVCTPNGKDRKQATACTPCRQKS